MGTQLGSEYPSSHPASASFSSVCSPLGSPLESSWDLGGQGAHRCSPNTASSPCTRQGAHKSTMHPEEQNYLRDSAALPPLSVRVSTTGTLHLPSSKTNLHLLTSWPVRGAQSISTAFASLKTCTLLYILYFNSTFFFNQASLLLVFLIYAMFAFTQLLTTSFSLPSRVLDFPFSNKMLEINSLEFCH